MSKVFEFSSCCLLFVSSDAVNLRSAGNKQRGHGIGDALVASNRFASTDGDGDQYLSSFADTLATDQQVLVNPEVDKVISAANRMADHQKLASDGLCTRSWNAPCPDGWEHLGKFMCSAPNSYLGACPFLQNFGGASALTKSKFADACKAPWPCQGGCEAGHDYDTCPEGWTSAGNGFCSGSGCAGMYKFDDLGIAEKQELAATCGFQWTCKGECQQDFSAMCPEGWHSMSGLCVAPATYAGDCDSSVNTEGMTKAQKQEFASKCGVRFGCHPGVSKSGGSGSTHFDKNAPVLR